jgi:hypothetical protein
MSTLSENHMRLMSVFNEMRDDSRKFVADLKSGAVLWQKIL